MSELHYPKAIQELGNRLDQKVRESQPAPPETLYHYTSADGLRGIVCSGKLWATSAYHLNDSSEFLYGLQLAQSVLLNLKEERDSEYGAFFEGLRNSLTIQKDFVRFYVVCFCKEGNLLSMWRSYGSRGYCLGIKSAGVASRCIPFSIFTINACDPTISLTQIEYDPSKQEEIIRLLVNESLELYDELVRKDRREIGQLTAEVAHAILLRLASFKDPAFREEQEWRVLKRFAVGLDSKEVLFRTANGVIVPYVELDVFREQRKDSKLPLEIIRYGPSAPELATEEAIKLLLFSTGYGDVKIERSGIPLRA